MKTTKILILSLLCLCQIGFGQLSVTIKTGSDDLRSGQAAYLQLIFKNGTASQEFDLNKGQNWSNNSENTRSFEISDKIKADDILSIRIRHDGSPHKFGETYDNWNIDRFWASLKGVQIAQCSGTPWQRFTGESRMKDCNSSYNSNNKPSFEGCWNTQWTDCSGQRNGSKLTFSKTENDEVTGAWTGTADDEAGYRHTGFMVGKLKGKVVSGKWYEVLYKSSSTCPYLSYKGTFKFELDKNTFSGTWTDSDGPNKGCRSDMKWWGTRD